MYRSRYFFLVALVMSLFAFTSCSENDDDVEEYADWQNANDTYFTNLYKAALDSVSAGNANWKVIRTWTLNKEVATKAEQHIVVKVLNSGTGSGCPLYTDSVRVNYQGRLIPSASYKGGYVFDQSWFGDYNPATAMPAELSVNTVVDGFATALQNMRIGDRWLVYIPYNLGYGSTAKTYIPAYSTLIFDITLVAYYRGGAAPDYKSKRWVLR